MTLKPELLMLRLLLEVKLSNVQRLNLSALKLRKRLHEMKFIAKCAVLFVTLTNLIAPNTETHPTGA